MSKIDRDSLRRFLAQQADVLLDYIEDSLFVEAPPVTYKPGDIFEVYRERYLLAQVEQLCRMFLVNLKTGGWRRNSLEVSCEEAVTPDEISKMAGTPDWKHLPDHRAKAVQQWRPDSQEESP